MAFNYAKAQRIALKLLTENGRSVQLVKLNNLPNDVDQPWYGSEDLADSTITVTAVFVDPVSDKKLGSAEMLTNVGNDSSVKTGSQIAFIAATENLDGNGDPIDIATYHRMIDGGFTYRMVDIQTLAPGEVPLMYEVTLER